MKEKNNLFPFARLMCFFPLRFIELVIKNQSNFYGFLFGYIIVIRGYQKNFRFLRTSQQWCAGITLKKQTGT